MANILILMSEAARHTGTVKDHLNAFDKYSSHRVTLADSRLIGLMKCDINHFDCIVFHYSIVIKREM